MKLREFILPLVAALLVLAYVIPGLFGSLSGTDRQALLPDADSVSAMTFIGEEGTVRLERIDGVWRVVEPVRWKADEARMGNLMSRLSNIVIDTNVGTMKDAETYGILEDSAVLRLNLAGGGERSIRIGKPDDTYRSVFVSVDDDEAVYLVDASFMAYLPGDAKLVMDKTIYSVLPENIRRITAERNGATNTLIRAEDGWTFNGQAIDPALGNAAADQLAELDANIFFERDVLPASAEPAARISVETIDGNVIDTTFFAFEGDYLVEKGGKVLTVYGFKLDEKFRTFE